MLDQVLRASSVTAVLDRLQAAGLAVRAPHGSDRRQLQVVVTERGLAALGELRAAL